MMGGGGVGGAPIAGPPAQGPAAAPTLPTPSNLGGAGTPASPAAAPLSSPQKKKGLQAAGLTNVHIAVNMLEEALPAFGSESDEGADILKALNILRKHIQKKDHSDLVPAEVLQMVSRLPQMGGGTQVQQQILQQLKQRQPPPAA